MRMKNSCVADILNISLLDIYTKGEYGGYMEGLFTDNPDAMTDDTQDDKDQAAKNLELGKKIGEAQIEEEKKAAEDKK